MHRLKNFFISLFLVFYTVSYSYSSDIFDLDISGYKISKSLMDYFSKKEILGMLETIEEGSKGKFVRLEYMKKHDDYDGIAFFVKKDDPRKVIYAISAVQLFGNENIDLCMSKQKNIAKKISSTFSYLESFSGPPDYSFLYDGNSTGMTSEFVLEGGIVSVTCVDWSQVVEENTPYVDQLRFTLQSNVFIKSKKWTITKILFTHTPLQNWIITIINALAFYIDPETFVIKGLEEYEEVKLTISNNHKIDKEFLEYHKNQYKKKTKD